MGSQDTSLWAYNLATQNLGAKQKQILDALRMFSDATNAEIARRLGWPIDRVTPRMGELRKQGLVLQSAGRTCKATGGTAWASKAKHPVLPPAFEKKEPEKVEPHS
ncbi:MAG TPA: winged helix-turn-helix domain-containing protein [Terracidiphilus sp.]|jgi:predicted transcriptional regulator